MSEQQTNWIDDIEIENAQIKWGWSHFDGRADTFNDEGDRNFVVVIPPEWAERLKKDGWAIRDHEPMEEGDPMEHTLKVKISYKYEAPKIFMIRGDRKFRADEGDLTDIKRGTTEQIDVVIQPSRWVNGQKTGISAYVKEMYVKIQQSRFGAKYEEYEQI